MSLSLAVKRSLAAQSRAQKAAKVQKDFGSLAEQEAKDDIEADIIAIVELLTKDPQKVKPCLRACRSSVFLPQSNEGSNEFASTYIYLPKVTLEFLKTWLPTLCNRLTPEVVKELRRKDCQVLHKLMYRLSLSDPNDRIPHHGHTRFQEIMGLRHEAYAAPMGNLTWTVDYDIPWQTWGVFKLIPECPGTSSEDQVKEHVYSGIKVNGTNIEVPFDKNNMKVSGSWCVVKNWALKAAVLKSPDSMKPQIRLKCLDWFKPLPEFNAWWSKLSVAADSPMYKGSSNEEPDMPLSQGSQGSASGRRRGSAKASAPRSKKKALSPAALKALQSL